MTDHALARIAIFLLFIGALALVIAAVAVVARKSKWWHEPIQQTEFERLRRQRGRR